MGNKYNFKGGTLITDWRPEVEEFWQGGGKKAPGGEAGKGCPAEPADETSAQEKGRQGPLQGQRRVDEL